ncbi:MAG: multi-sensor signal transduction histidine kinase [Paenibacillaceae bacterium]|jgi:PAS domain S-box-containing protein|nr:multi-sensor signal transduction histidine kinase [Paenibacillaceae bacterium]
MTDTLSFSQTVEIIIVDDRRENLIAMEAVLSNPLYRLICLNSGDQTLQYLKNANTSRLAVILLDVQMPGMDGFETARLIKSRKAMQNVPIIFLTAISKTEAYMEKGYSSGAVDYIFKPFNPDILRGKIKAYVQIHYYQRELERANELLQQKTAELETNNRKLQAAEQELSRINIGLEQTIEERTSSLRLAYQEIHDSHLLFRSVFSMSPCLLAIRSLPEKRFADINDTWQTVTGYTLDEMNELPADSFVNLQRDQIHPAIAPSDPYEHNGEVTFRTKSGEIRYGLFSGQLLELNGSLKQLVVIMDVTDRKQWEIQSSRLERLHLIGEMAAAIAHEVRNPMTTVHGFLQLSRKNHTLLVPEYIEIMLEELGRANGIITEFLTLAKNKATDLKLHPLNDIIASILPLLQAEALISGKEVQAQYSPVPKLRLDEKEIRQLILNIAMNGLDSMGEGGTLRISTEYEEDEVRMMIADEGAGIPEAVLKKIGTPFFTTKEKGTGLGLAVCYSIASRHNASIVIDTGSWGTCFTICFPYIDTDNSST